MFYHVKITLCSFSNNPLKTGTCQEGEQREWNEHAKRLANKHKSPVILECSPATAIFRIEPDPDVLDDERDEHRGAMG